MNTAIFEQIKKINAYNQEYWNSRELAQILEYSDYRNFENAIAKAKTACQKSGQNVKEHFVDSTETQKSRNQYGETQGKTISLVVLSRYACYLIAQNRRLFGVAKSIGVSDYANFQDAGYMGLYGGLRQKDIRAKKKLKEKDNILNHMGSEELGANIFRATQTSAKIKRENITGQHSASLAHHEVGKEIRKTIERLGGTMPEKLSSSALPQRRNHPPNLRLSTQKYGCFLS